MHRNKLYVVLGLACIAGYGWLFLSIMNLGDSESYSPCFIKNITGVPCPSCGATRALMMLMRGDIWNALMWNPLGVVIGFCMAVIPPWLIADIILGKKTLFDFYRKTEQTVRIKWVATSLIVLLLANWIWNIYKNV